MKLTYLGTAAAEGFPAVFCNCEFCKEARRLGGKNIRTRSQALINDDLLIDFPADTYMHFLNNNIEGDKIKYLVVTHSHPDHFYPYELDNRHGAYAHDMRVPELKVYCSGGARERFKVVENEAANVSLTVAEPFNTFTLGNYTVTALPARHLAGDGAVFYMIKGDKTILYAHDTGYFYDEVFEYLEKNSVVFDLVSLDCTCVDLPTKLESHHMGLEKVGAVIDRLTAIGAVNDSTVKVINHFSHNGEPIHHKLEQRVSSLGYLVSYDGFSIEI